MRSTQYLFGISPSELDNKFYLDALKYKLEAGQKLFIELNGIEKPTFEERERLFYVTRALDFTRELIEEVKEDMV